MLQVSYADMEFIPHFFSLCCIEHAFCKHNNSHQLDSTTWSFFFLETFTKLFLRPIQTQCTLLLLSGLYFSNPFKETDSPEIEMVHRFITQSLCLGQYYFCFYQITVFTDICYLFSAVLMYPKTKVCYFVIFWFLKFTF